MRSAGARCQCLPGTVVVASLTTGDTMIVEFPNVQCEQHTGPVKRRRIAAARTALIHRCGTPGTGGFQPLHGIATIDGVGFFDVRHGQRGVAANGIELHPALRVVGAAGKQSEPQPVGSKSRSQGSDS